MLGSLQVGVVRGIPVRLHFSLIASFILLVLTFGAAGVPAGVILFGSVLLHELGHSVVAQRFQIPISSITLHLLGGMAMMTRRPANARQEILIAAAGPAVSLAIGLVLLFLSMSGADVGSVDRPTLLGYGAVVNLAMFAFNLAPALPMDGGRILRAMLSLRLGPYRATRLAARISRVVSALFTLAGLYWHVWSLVMIAVLLLVLAANEERTAAIEEAMGRQDSGLPPFARVFVRPLAGAGGAEPGATGPIIDEAGNVIDEGREERRELVDPYGRRYIVVTRVG